MNRMLRPLAFLFLLLCSSSLFAYEKRTLCVWDIVGNAGPIADAVKEYQLEALKWGVDFQVVVNTSERVITEQFRAKQCDAAVVSELRIRNFVKFAGSLFAVGGIPDFDHLRLMHQLLATPQSADKMREGPFEIAGIVPGGAVYVFVRDRSINSLQKAVGRKVAVMGDDKYQQQMVELIGATPVSVTEATAGSMFNNGALDVLPAPAVAYGPLELYRGLAPDGGIIRFPLSQISAQVIFWHERFPKDYGQKSREYFYANFDRALHEITKAESQIDEKWWVDIPDADKAQYDTLMDEVRIQAVQAGYWDGEMIKLQRRVRCKFDPKRAECSKPRDVL
jgi:hypothetical protein